MKHIMTGTVMLAFSAFAADVNVQWTKGGTPETLGDGAVSLTYDAGLVKSAITRDNRRKSPLMAASHNQGETQRPKGKRG